MTINDTAAELPASAQDRGELLLALKQFARERYLQLEIGTNTEFEELWRKGFFADELQPESQSRHLPNGNTRSVREDP